MSKKSKTAKKADENTCFGLLPFLHSPAFASAFSSASFARFVLIKSSCLAPALSAMAFQPFCVGTVTRTWILPRASRTGRITPGINRPDLGIRRQQALEQAANPGR